MGLDSSAKGLVLASADATHLERWKGMAERIETPPEKTIAISTASSRGELLKALEQKPRGAVIDTDLAYWHWQKMDLDRLGINICFPWLGGPLHKESMGMNCYVTSIDADVTAFMRYVLLDEALPTGHSLEQGTIDPEIFMDKVRYHLSYVFSLGFLAERDIPNDTAKPGSKNDEFQRNETLMSTATQSALQNALTQTDVIRHM